MSGLALAPHREGVRLAVRVTPRSSRNGIDGEREGRLVVRVTAPPVDDAANIAVIEIVSEALNLPRRHVAIVSGARSRSKTLALSGITPGEVRQRLSVILGHPV